MYVHPYVAAWRTRDLDAWARALAPDVEMHSPIFSTSFKGRDAAVELFGVLFEHVEAFEVTDELCHGSTYAFCWRAQMGGGSVEGVDVIRGAEHGKITEITVSIRPLKGIATFGAVVGPPLAARRGALNLALLRLLTLPFNAILALADALASRLVQRR